MGNSSWLFTYYFYAGLMGISSNLFIRFLFDVLISESLIFLFLTDLMGISSKLVIYFDFWWRLIVFSKFYFYYEF